MKALSGGGSLLRRNIPIIAYVGTNGAGKTLAMVHDTMPTLEGVEWSCEDETHKHTEAGVTRGVRPVLSTVRITDPRRTGDDGRPVGHVLWEKLTSWKQLYVAEHADVLLDEVTGAASSRSFQQLPPQLMHLFLQLRKADCVVRYTTPNWGRTDVVLREVTKAVTVCKGFFWEKVEGRVWHSNRMFRWATYDAVDWESLSMQKVARARPIHVAWYWRPGRAAEHHYSTYGAVAVMDHISESGLCLVCGGTVRRPRCKCPGPVVEPTSWDDEEVTL